MQIDRLDTISADDVVTVASVEGAEMLEISLTVDTGDEKTSTRLSASQARKLAEALMAHASGERQARHSAFCYVEQVNNGMGDVFWVCGPGCPTLAAR